MRKLLAALLLSISLPASARESKDDSIRFESTVELTWDNYKPGDEAHHCTAFNIGDYLVSAGHCAVKLDQPVNVRSTTGAKIATAVPMFVDNIDDVSLWQVRGTALIDTVSVDCRPTHLGQEIIVKGWPQDLGYAETWGHIIGQTKKWARENWRLALLTDAMADHGNSGGPVVDAKTGRVVAILVGGYLPDQQVYTILAPVTSLCAILDL